MDRNADKINALNAKYRRSLRGNVDRNELQDCIPESLYRRSLRGNVDRNEKGAHEIEIEVVSFPTWERG